MPALSSVTEEPASYSSGDEEGGSMGEDEAGVDEEAIALMWRRFMGQSTVIHNATEDDEHKIINCFHQFVQSDDHMGDNQDAACPVKFDGVSCWPQTPGGMLRSIPCFEVFNGVYYDPSENNASLLCYPNGTWSSRSFYNHCLNAVTNNSSDHGSALSTTKTIFYIGNSISLIAVTLALWIFISFKDLRCLRNTIHANLLFTYLLHNLFWILYASVQALMAVSVGCFFYVTLNYFTFTNFMWMFVEGFYLYMLVVKTFSVENIKLRVYTLIGWGVPVPIIVIWVLVKTQVELEQQTGGDLGGEGMEMEGMYSSCPLMPATPIDWLHKIPILVVLCLNLVFLTTIMWVLITKLRSANTVETQRYRKATKALLVLIPLLGLTYILLILLPQELEHVRAVLLSTQGFWVALFYCFLNSEVQNSIRHHIERWKTARGLTDPRNPSVRHRDESPRPKTDCSSYGRRLFGSKRESLCSEVTTMTTFVANGYNPVSTQTTNTLPLPTSQSQPMVGSLSFRNSTAGLPQYGAPEEVKATVKDSLL